MFISKLQKIGLPGGHVLWAVDMKRSMANRISRPYLTRFTFTGIFKEYCVFRSSSYTGRVAGRNL